MGQSFGALCVGAGVYPAFSMAAISLKFVHKGALLPVFSVV